MVNASTYLNFDQWWWNVQSILDQTGTEILIRFQIENTDPVNVENGCITRQFQNDRFTFVFSDRVQT